MSALFIIQKEVSQDREKLFAALNAEGLPYRVLRFGRATEKRPSFDIASAIPLGSVAFVSKAQRCGWGGVWRPVTLNYDAYEKGWGPLLLNAHAPRYTLGTVPDFEGFRFIRPVADSKAFNGTVVEGRELGAWVAQASDYNGDATSLDTPVIVTEAVNISREWRCFVVDGKVCAASLYHADGRLQMDASVPRMVTEFAAGCVSIWQPAAAFVLDIGWSGNVLRIIEAGCINCAGFYAADPRPVLRALADLHECRATLPAWGATGPAVPLSRESKEAMIAACTQEVT